MTELRPYNAKRQLIDVDHFISLKDDSYLMCISGAMVYALRKLAKTRLLWPTSYAKTQEEQYYVLPEAVDIDVIEDVVSEWLQDTEDIEMCNQALLTALENINDTIRLSTCCAEAGAGARQDDGIWRFGTEDPLSEPTAFGPGEEFATEEEWETHKCEVANGIVNALIGSLNGLSILTFAQLNAAAVVAGLVGLGLIAVPPIAILTAIIVTGLAFGALALLSGEIDDNREELVCVLYNSTSATQAYDNLRESIEEFGVDLGWLEIQVGTVADLVMNMVSLDGLNKLYSNVGLPTIEGDLVDCDAVCAPCAYNYENLVFTGTPSLIGSGPDYEDWQIDAVYVPGLPGYQAKVYYSAPYSVPCGCGFTFEMLTSPTTLTYYGEYRCVEGEGVGLFNVGRTECHTEEVRYGLYTHHNPGAGDYSITLRIRYL